LAGKHASDRTWVLRPKWLFLLSTLRSSGITGENFAPFNLCESCFRPTFSYFKFYFKDIQQKVLNTKFFYYASLVKKQLLRFYKLYLHNNKPF